MMISNTVNIFLASSFEMGEWRLAISDAVRRWNESPEFKGCRIRLKCWEDVHPEYHGERKQNEYNDELVLKSDMLFALFRDRCGKYTQEEIKIGKNHLPSEKLVVFCDKNSVNQDSVNRFLESEGLDYILCDDVNVAIQEIRASLHEHIDSLPCRKAIYERPNDIVNIYATIPDDRRSERLPFSNMIRYMDAYAEDNLDLHCLLKWDDIAEIDKTHYYAAILKDYLSQQEEDEITDAITKTAPNSHPQESVLYYNPEDKAISNCERLSKLLAEKEPFNEAYPGIDRVKFNLLVWLISRRVSEINADSGLYVKGGVVRLDDWAIVRAEHLDISGITDQDKEDALFELIRKSLLHFHKHGNNRDLDINDLKARFDDNNRYGNLTRRIHEDYIGHTRNLLEDVNKHLSSIEVSMDSSKDYLDLMRMKSRLEQNLLGLTVQPMDALRTLQMIAGICDNYEKFVPDLGYTSNQAYRDLINFADRNGIVDPVVEMQRMNYANSFARDNNPDRAISLYKTSFHNILGLVEDISVFDGYLLNIFNNYTHYFLNLGLYDEANSLSVGYEKVLNRMKKKSSASYADVLRREAALLDVKLRNRRNDDYRYFIQPSLELRRQLLTIHEFDDDDYIWTDLYCDFPMSIATALLDMRDKNNYRENSHLALKILLNLMEMLANRRISNLELKLFYYGQAYHNIAFAYKDSDVRRMREFAIKALTCREIKYSISQSKEDRGLIAETMLLLGATYIHCKSKYMSERSYEDAIKIANSSLNIYSSLYKRYPEQELNIYEAKLLIGTLKSQRPEYQEEGFEIIKECLDWSRQHPGNNCQDIFESEAKRILPRDLYE